MRTAKSKVQPHLPTVDAAVPADQRGRDYCTCGVVIADGDPRHTLPTVPEQAAVAARYDHEAGEA